MYQNIFYDRDTRTIHLWDSDTGYRAFPYKRYAYAKHPDGTHLSMFGDRLKKIHGWEAESSLELFESDVSPTTRTLVDLYTDDDIPSDGHTTGVIDIEVEVTHGLPDWRNPINKITSIALYDNRSEEYVVFILDEEDQLSGTSHETATIIPCHTERNLLERFLDRWEQISPTIVTGWNIDGFDIPYLYSRLQYALGNDDALRLSPIGIVTYNETRGQFFIAGVSSLDYMVLYKKFSYTHRPSYALNAIGLAELNLGKIEYDGTLDDLFANDIAMFVDYNIRDVEIVVKLDEKFEYIELVRGICHAGHVAYEDYAYSSRYLDGAVLTFLKRRGVVAPNKPKRTKETMKQMGSKRDKFAGAYVKSPNPGRYEWVYDLDLTSLYPSIIMSLNISPETKLGKVENWDTNAFLRGKDKTYLIRGSAYSYEELRSFIDDNGVAVSSNGVLYNTNEQGVLPAILNEWFDKRVEYKNLMKKHGNEGDTEKYEFYDKRQLVQKILLNSLYGVLGLPVFRFYDVDNAEAVTTTGKKVIRFTEKMGNQYYNTILNTHEIYVNDENEATHILKSTDLIKIERDGVKQRIFGSDILEGDILFIDG